MTDVFISYSRQNLEFAEELFAALEKRGISAWVDWQNIPRSAGWWDEIKRGIDTASTFVYILSNDSLGSAVCTLELAHAIGDGKRIIPVVIEQPNFEAAFGKIAAVQPDEILSGMLAGRDILLTARANRTTIGHINWIFFGQTPQGEDKPYDESLEELIETVNTDLEHNRRHARLLVRAREWENGRKADDLLLIGDEIAAAEKWLAEADGRAKMPTPTDLQRAYIAQSRVVENRRRRVLRSLQLSAFAAVAITVVAFVVTAILTNNAQSIVNNSSTEVAGAQGTLTQIPPTLAAIATDVQGQRNVSDALRLANEARSADERGEPFLALALALEAVKIPGAPNSVEKTLADLAYDSSAKKRFNPATSMSENMAFSPDGRFAFSSLSINLLMWDVASEQILRTFRGHTGSVTSVAISSDGRLAVSGSDDKTLIVWDIATGEVLRTLQGHLEGVTSVAISSDGRLAISGSGDKTLIVWDITTGEALRTLQGHLEGVTSVAFSMDGKLAISGSYDDTVMVWNVGTEKALRTLRGHSDWVSSVAFSPDGRRVLSGSWDTTLIVWDIAFGIALGTLRGHTDTVSSVVFSSDGRFALSGSYDGTLIVWDLNTGNALRTLRGHMFFVESAAFVQNAVGVLPPLVISSSLEATILWEVEPRELLRRLHGNGPFYSVAFSSDGQLALATSWDHNVTMWDIQTGALMGTLSGHTAQVNSVAFSPNVSVRDFTLVASGSNDGTVIVWDIAKKEALRTLRGHTNPVNSVAFSPDGRLVLSGSGDTTLMVWDVETGEVLRTLHGHTGSISSVAFSSDGRLALSGSWDNSIIVWDVATGEVLRTLRGHGHAVNSVAFSPDGRLALSGSWDNSIIVWDVVTGKVLRTLRGHGRAVNSVAFSKDGRLAVSGSIDRTIIVWDVETGESLRTLRGHTDVINAVVFSPDGRFVLSASSDQTLIVWRFESQNTLIDWLAAERYVQPLTCSERAAYHIQTSCTDPTITPISDLTQVTAIPWVTLTPSSIYTPTAFDWTQVPLTLPVWTSIATPTSSITPTRTPTSTSTIDSTRITLTPIPTLTPTQTPQRSGEAKLGENRGEITVSGGQVWTYQGVTGESLTISVIADNPGSGVAPNLWVEQGRFDSWLFVYQPDGTFLAQNDDLNGEMLETGSVTDTNSRLSDLVLPIAGSYTFEIRSAYDGITSGAYTLIIESSRAPDVTPTPTRTPAP